MSDRTKGHKPEAQPSATDVGFADGPRASLEALGKIGGTYPHANVPRSDHLQLRSVHGCSCFDPKRKGVTCNFRSS